MVLQQEQHKFRRQFYLEKLEYWERFLKSKADCGSISTIFSGIVLLCVSSIIIIIIIIILLLIIKTIVAIKIVLLIKIMSLCHHHHKTLKKLCSYLEIAFQRNQMVFYWPGNSIISFLSSYGYLIQRNSDAFMIIWSQLLPGCNQDHVILPCGTNDLSSARNVSQIVRSIIQFSFSLKWQDNKISISLIVPKSTTLNQWSKLSFNSNVHWMKHSLYRVY